MSGKKRRPKVLIAGHQGHITEAEMIQGLRERDIDIHAAFESTSPHLETLRSAGIPTQPLDLKNNIDFRSAYRIRKWIKQEGFDIVHGLANRPVANFIWASYGLPNKVIAYRGTAGHVSRWDPTCYIKWLNPRIDRIICLSKAVEASLEKSGVASKRLITIYKGHDPGWYADLSPAAARDEVNQQFSLPDNTILVGMAANMRPVKGADLLLNLLMDLPENVHGLLIGEVRDPSINDLASNPRIANRLHFTGFRRDATHLIGALDINVAPSRAREGLGKSVIEAMIQGIPSVVSNVGGLPELLGPDGMQYIFPTGDLKRFRECMAPLINNSEERKIAGDFAKQRIYSEFTLERTINETKNLYHSML